MSNIIITVVCVGIGSGIISLFFDDDAELSKYIRLVLSLCFLCSIVPGGVKLFSQLDIDAFIPRISQNVEFDSLIENYNSALAEETSEKLSEELGILIFENTGIKPDHVNIQLNVTSRDDAIVFSFETIRLTLKKDKDSKTITEYVYSICGIEPEIIYESQTE